MRGIKVKIDNETYPRRPVLVTFQDRSMRTEPVVAEVWLTEREAESLAWDLNKLRLPRTKKRQ